ncbi:MAG: molybdopterin molybdotransferase MoeA [Alphaproteobacteria bacterium]|nr:molybdopterin molybdotransferase MoeA [Alphaproteobacteria bacterium]
MVSLDQALDIVACRAAPGPTERVRLEDAGGRVLARPAIARRTAPASDVSAMDGYAVRSDDLKSLPALLRLAGRTFAGEPAAGALVPGTAARVFTGAPLPPGADRVVLQEEVRADGAVVVVTTAGGKPHVRSRGSDFRAGDILVPTATTLTPGCLVAAAAADLAELEVFARPKVSILATGDELRPPGMTGASPETIPDSVSVGVSALARLFGAKPTVHSLLRDEPASLRSAAKVAAERADIVIVIGGASVGERDYARTMFGPDLDISFSKVRMRPAKPTWFGSAHGTLVLGLPGNPVAALVAARLFLAPLLCGLCGLSPRSALRWRKAPLATELEPTSDFDLLLCARPREDAVEVLANRDSSAQSALAQTGLLVRRRPNAPSAVAGTFVETLDF